ncbi:MAG TPA: hypothetical protein VMZ28_01525 [Kofleriaceae bacterium]|nr:hypothetical protein [Kofleriaceae bacterium]
MRLVRSLAWTLCVAACSSAPHRPAPATPPTPVARPDAPPATPLPPGVLARAQGTQGVIQVEEKDGLRLLTIDGKVQAAVRPGDTTPDPAVTLLRAMRPKARRVLVIGLGSGRTAGDLTAAGFEVEAVELEPAVVDMARAHFGYKGHAAVGDGLAFVNDAKGRWDVILVDALTSDAPPAAFTETAGLTAMFDHLEDGGVLAIRLLGEPPLADPIRQRIHHVTEGRHTALYGSGVGAEPQNLVLFGSKRPLNAINVAEVTLWPVPSDLPAYAMPRDAGQRKVELIGYLIRMPDGGLAVDLPHEDMGAVRYLLRGDAVAGLQGELPAKLAFPTTGDIGSDGDTRKTLTDLLGGGGVKRSDLRFSPVVVALEGVARLISVVHPDAASRVPEDMRMGAPTDERLPYGGALYELEVTQVGAVFELAAWQKTLAPLRRAAAEVTQGRLSAAARLISEHADAVEKAFGPFAERTAALRRARKLAIGLTGAAADVLGADVGTQDRALAIAAACERVREEALEHPAGFEGAGALAPVMTALQRCADRFRKKAKEPHQGGKT